MSDLETLTSFGFDTRKSQKALRKTGNSGLQPALDWLQENEDDDGQDSGSEAANTTASSSEPAAVAKSLKCLECGKVFRSTEEASYHGDKSGHADFEEFTEEKKPLTEEERKEKLAELRAKAAAKKAAQSITDKEEAKRNEEIRRKGGKELNQIKEELKLKEALKAADEAKRDKIEDAKARARIKAQIEADKKEKAEKFAREKAIRDGKPVGMLSSEKEGPKPAAANTLTAGAKDKKETRLQIRLPSGNPLITTRKSEDTLQSVLDWVKENIDIVIEGKISIPFPRKVFSSAEMQKSLLDLGLVPSSVLIVN